jgi:hypothetical protein
VSDDVILKWFPYVFPFLFVGGWLLITTMLGLMSGWFNLQQWYADDDSEQPLLKLRGQSGTMGMGVSMGGCLQLRAYRSGLGIRIWRIFGPFQKPLRIAWTEIDAEPSKSFFMPMMTLRLGRPSNGTLKISARSWSRLLSAVESNASTTFPKSAPTDKGAAARALLIQWLVITAAAGAFSYMSAGGQRGGQPVVTYFAFPAILFGICQVVRFARS